MNPVTIWLPGFCDFGILGGKMITWSVAGIALIGLLIYLYKTENPEDIGDQNTGLRQGKGGKR